MSLCDPALRRAILNQLLSLNFHALLRAIALVLESMGYEDVKLSGRTGFVGRNQAGGFDIEAFRPVPGGRRHVLVRVKQYPSERKVFLQALHELRGVCLEKGAAEGMLVTTSSFSESIAIPPFASAAMVPLRLIDGKRLADLLALFRVGVQKGHDIAPLAPQQLQLDPTYFQQLERSYKGVARVFPPQRKFLGVVVSITPRKRR